MEPRSLENLFAHIQGSVAETDQCYMHYFAGVGGRWEPPFIVSGRLSELISFATSHERVSPDYWWSTDRSWCVHTDYDSTVTDVGGPSRLCESIEADPWFEVVPIPDPDRTVG